jgi:hypothetical protein
LLRHEAHDTQLREGTPFASGTSQSRSRDSQPRFSEWKIWDETSIEKQLKLNISHSNRCENHRTWRLQEQNITSQLKVMFITIIHLMGSSIGLLLGFAALSDTGVAVGVPCRHSSTGAISQNKK